MMTALAVLAIIFFSGVIGFTAYVGWHMSRPENSVEAFKEALLRDNGYSDEEVKYLLSNPDVALCSNNSSTGTK